MKKFSVLTFLSIALIAVIFQSCDKTELAELSLRFSQSVGSQEIVSGASYTINGSAVDINTANLYISNFRLQNEGGQQVSLPGYMLVSPNSQNFSLGSFLENGYTKVLFDVGIDSTVNHADPSQYPVGDVLGAQTPSMHWSWMMGYIFMRLDGVVDADGDSAPETAFEVHFGTDNFLKTIELDYPFTANGGENYTIDIAFDVEKLFDGIDITTDNTTHVGDNPTLAADISANMQKAFSIQ